MREGGREFVVYWGAYAPKKSEKKLTNWREWSQNQKKSNERVQINSFLKEIPQPVKNLIGEDYYLYPLVWDGACGLRAIAGWIFQDPSAGITNRDREILEY